MPGLEMRLPLMFDAMVSQGRMGLSKFVELTATAPARIYGLPGKGSLAIGADADIAIWDAELERTIKWADLHDNVGYSPYEGRQVRGWPTTVVSRGRVVVENGKLSAERGSGQFLKCDVPDAAKPLEKPQPELAAMTRFGARPLF